MIVTTSAASNGRKINVLGYGIMKRVVPLSASEEANLFDTLLKLYEAEDREVRRSILEQWGADIEMLRAGGFLNPLILMKQIDERRESGAAFDESTSCVQAGACRPVVPKRLYLLVITEKSQQASLRAHPRATALGRGR